MSGSVNEFDVINEVNDYIITELTSNQSVMNMNASDLSQNLSTSSLTGTFPEFHYDEQLMNLLTEWKLDLVYTTCIGKIENNLKYVSL